MAKRLVVCLDGTWKTPETEDGRSHPSNVLKFLRALRRTARDGQPQIVYYQRGVGSENMLDKWLGGAFGWGLSRNVMDAYRWIANNYEAPGDTIFLVGFSRGAYTARSLAGLIGAVGLMTKLEIGALPEAYAYYRTPPEERRGHPYHATATSTMRLRPRIRFVGVFDTVGSLGVPLTLLQRWNRRRFGFHDVQLGHAIENAYQALAIDEHRRPFEPAIWEKPPGWNGRLEQMWFVGAHTNVGGGYRDSRLSDIALRWIIGRAMRCGLNFDREYVRRFIEKPPLHDGRMGDEFKGFYRLYGRFHREVAVDSERDLRIHPSAKARRADPALGYGPDNVRWT